MTEKPLHVQVAEALGWTDISCAGPKPILSLPGKGASLWGGLPPGFDPRDAFFRGDAVLSGIPRYDTDWSATGPLIERLGIATWPQSEGWAAELRLEDRATGPTPLIAVCNLILALHAAGKLAA